MLEPDDTRLTLTGMADAAVLGAYHEGAAEVFTNPLVEEMGMIRQVLPLSRAELVRNVQLPELDVSRLLNRGLDEKTITKTEGKGTVKYDLP